MRLPLLLCAALGVTLDDVARSAEPSTSEAISKAVEKSIPLIAKAAAGSAKQRQCFTCHNQAMPVLVMSYAKERGLSVDETILAAQVKHTLNHLEKGVKNYTKGRGQGGQGLTAGYALWALGAGGHEPDETTSAVSHYLLEYQKKTGHWTHRSKRPPSADSNFTATYVALLGLHDYSTDEQQARHSERKNKVAEWLVSQDPAETEDRVFRLRALKLVDAKSAIEKAAQQLVDSQQSDGGWAQKSDMKSDAYATGSVLVALLRDSGLEPDHDAIQRGISYLLDTQKADGSWHVKTRAKPFQKHYESGFPHEKDQFISISASCWATIALMLSEPNAVEDK